MASTKPASQRGMVGTSRSNHIGALLGLHDTATGSTPSSTVYVAKPSQTKSASDWKPRISKHVREGEVLLRGSGDGGLAFGGDGATELRPAAFSRKGGLQSSASSPSLRSQGAGSPVLSSAEALQRLRGASPHETPSRRTVVLASAHLASNNRWTSSLTHKAFSPKLRGDPSRAVHALSPAPEPPGIVGDSVDSTSDSIDAREQRDGRRLLAGHEGLWDNHSRYRIVCDLYDGYAADPVGEHDRGRKLNSTTSPQAKSTKRVLARYVERQAEIEGLLMQRAGVICVDDHFDTTGVALLTDDSAFAQREDGEARARQSLEEEKATVLPPAYETIAMTPNATLSGTLLFNDVWSAGALFHTVCSRSFRLTIRPQQALEFNPVFIGIAPVDADLTVLNFFYVGDGVFLCMGGIASAALIASLGAPGGPSFHAMGVRTPSRLRVPPLGSTLTVEYSETMPDNGAPPEGHVMFIVGDEDDEGTQYARPELSKKLMGGGVWRPCVLLCNPHTAVRVERLT